MKVTVEILHWDENGVTYLSSQHPDGTVAHALLAIFIRVRR
jgi:hypothetical protein